jgi:hypothetical protein
MKADKMKISPQNKERIVWALMALIVLSIFNAVFRWGFFPGNEIFMMGSISMAVAGAIYFFDLRPEENKDHSVDEIDNKDDQV